MKSDVLIIGGGVSGLTTAIHLAKKRTDLQITVLTKVNKEESNTRYAQGGIAAVWDFDMDNFQKHIDDTLDAGDGICDEQIVEIVIKEGVERIKEIMKWGTRFDKDETGKFDLGREGGHSEHRVLHYKDLTGWEIQRSLLEKAKTFKNIKILEHYFALDLLTQHHLGRHITRITPNKSCFGAYVLNLNTHKIEKMLARITVLATGGVGQIYKSTTNPAIATGDGIAMVYRAKGRLSNMEFIQFHPTSLYTPYGEQQAFLISEAVRGFGAILKLNNKQEFMEVYDKRKSLAPRDIVARAIDNEMKKRGEDNVLLDCTHLNKEKFIAHFPTIYNKCIDHGIDPMQDMIPVVPACHYQCGGIDIDAYGKSSIHRLYAAGECTDSGLHGANRLASNSLLEGLVFGYRVHEDILTCIDDYSFQEGIPEWNAEGTSAPEEMVLITQSLKELKDIMSYYVGIVRNNVRIKRALDRLWLLYTETEQLYANSTISPQLCELRNLITNAYLVTKSASYRKESVGLHYTTDYPDKFDYKETSYL